MEPQLPGNDGEVDRSSTETPDALPLSPNKPALTGKRRHRSHRTSFSNSTEPPQQILTAKKFRQGRTPKIKVSKKKSSNADDVWEVEEVVGSLIEADTYIHYYQVKWKGYSSKENTWEPKKHLSNCHEAIERFERSKRR